MDDELKNAWQSQSASPRLNLDASVVLSEVRRNERQFAAMIFYRDAREVIVALLLVPVWIYLGLRQSLPWSHYLVVPALLWIAGFLVVDRLRQRGRQPRPDDPLRRSLKASLAQVNHQITLLRNIFWWYLLPPGLALIAFPAHRAWLSRDDGWPALGEFAGILGTFLLVGWLIHWLNQRAVRTELEPRRQELLAWLSSLEDSNEPPPPPETPAGPLTV